MMPAKIDIIEIAARTDLTAQQAEAIVQARERSFRVLGEDAKNAAAQAIVLVCKLFGMDAPTNEALALSLGVITKQFPSLSAAEVVNACQLYAAGKIEAPQHFGKFDAKWLGNVLNAYLSMRSNFIHQLEKSERLLALASGTDLQKQAKFDAEFPAIFKAAKFDSWEDVPGEWYDIALRLGLYVVDEDEKAMAWDYSEELARADIEKDAQASDLISARSLLRSIEGATPKERRILIAKKLLIFNHLNKNA